MIQAKELRKVYKTKGGVVVNALDGVSLKLPDTGMVFILGKSGSGKSTLLNVLGGLDSIDSGEIIIKGSSAKDFKQSHYDSYRNTYIGFIFQEYNVLEELTVGANVALAIELQGRKATDEEINKILCEVDLEGYGARKPNELSGGQKQRVAIARALVKNPEIIMADEPTGALDSATGKQVFDTLKKLSRDKLVLIVSHDREFSEQYADRIVELKDGVIISDVEKSGGDFCEADEQSESITYEGNEIKIEKGYMLTEEDRIAINSYLEAIKDGATISVQQKKRTRAASCEFVDTDESKIVSSKSGDFKLIKSKLSLKNAFKLGSGGLKHKKFRLAFTIFLSIISFLLFGLADTIAAYNNVTTATQSIYDTGVNYASFVKSLKRVWGEEEDDFYWTNDNAYLSVADIAKIEENTGAKVVGVFSRISDLDFSDSLGSLDKNEHNISALYPQKFTGITPINSQLLSEFGFSLVGENSRLPEQGKKEIVIPLFLYEQFEYTGYSQRTDEGVLDVEIKSPDDLIGKTINISLEGVENMYGGGIFSNEEYTIVGIIDTKFDYERYEPLLDANASVTLSTIEYMSLTKELDSARNYSFACVGFVSPDRLTGLVEKATNGPQSFNGYLELFLLKNDGIVNNVEDIWQNHENVSYQNSYQTAIRLEKIKDDVLWFGSPLESLNSNQIIIPLDLYNALVNYQSLGGGDGKDPLYNDSTVYTGFEQTYLQKALDGTWWNAGNYVMPIDFINNIESIAYYKYAYENLATVKPIVVDFYVDNGWYSEEDIAGISDDQIINEYVSGSYDGRFDGVTEEYLDAYYTEFITKYNLQSSLLSSEELAKIRTTVEYGGFEYTANDYFITRSELAMNYQRIFCNKYAYENVTDVVNYYKSVNPEFDKDMMGTDFASMANMYVNFLQSKYFDRYGMVTSDFEPASTVDVVKYVNNAYAEFLKAEISTTTLDKLVINSTSYNGGANKFLKGVEIVGINIGEYNTIVTGTEIYDMLVGKGEGGIYSFATGKMPESTSEIGKIVEFSKTYENDGEKYDLKNNVTEQLDMVDELLEVLGQVFLYVGIGFAVFASLMLSNFIGTSIAHKKQEIGILRAIGSRSADVFRIFFAESFVIAMINFILSAALTLTACIVLNGVLRTEAGLLITFLSFGVRQVALLLIVSVGVAFLATFFPVKKIASKKPIDAIKNRK